MLLNGNCMTRMISHRARGMDADDIRKAFALAARLKDPVNMSIGQPDFPVPDAVKKAAAEAIRLDHNSYTLTQGIQPLRAAVAEKLRTRNGIPNATEDTVMITAAVSGALALALPVCIDSGDEVIVFDPSFAGYKQMVILFGGVPVVVPLTADFAVDPRALRAAITSRTRAIIFNTPANPTGHVATREEIHALAEIAREHDLTVFSDEIYEDFIYDDVPHLSIGSVYEKTVTMSGFSKSHAMTGWRVGYAHAPAAIADRMMTIQQYTFVCAPTPFQYAACAALTTDISAQIARYKTNRDTLYDALREDYDIVRPGGAFYFFVPYPYDAGRFLARCMEHQLLVVPGSTFSACDTHFRLSFATTADTITRAIDILHKLSLTEKGM